MDCASAQEAFVYEMPCEHSSRGDVEMLRDRASRSARRRRTRGCRAPHCYGPQLPFDSTKESHIPDSLFSPDY